MDNVPGLLATKSFWLFYQLGEDYPIEEGLLERFATRHKETGGRYSLTIRLYCPCEYAIEVEVLFDLCALNLFLVNDKQNSRYELGWWDAARWHPFALRWDELVRLLGYWETHPTNSPVDTKAALLLFARFVGNGINEAEELPGRKKQVAAAYHGFGHFSPFEVALLVDSTVLGPPEDDYQWTRDPNLGWVF